MYNYSKQSKINLSSCHIDLQNICYETLKIIDHSIICGFRGEEEQNEAFYKGNSQLQFPNSKHNKTPAMAVDVMPYPIDWHDIKRIYHFAGHVLAVAYMLKEQGIISHGLKWGGNWKNFKDYPHYELIML
jgi:peptidoglycan L-alanyl-D-glutamate endopeptidase CwlK